MTSQLTPPVYGLVLAGGMSQRMHKDKAALEYQGKPQLDRAYELVSAWCEQTYVSVRADQLDDPVRRRFPTIADRKTDLGPIAGIAAAQETHPHAAWLVVACDLPFLDAGTLEDLLKHRDTSQFATAFKSAHDGLPEPLCAIWEPASRAAVTAWIAAGKQCPRKLLINSPVRLLPARGHALDNINTPEEFAAAHGALAATQSEATLKTLRVQYFALLREQAGRSEETVTSTAATPAMLYRELQGRYPFRLQKEQLRVAVNTEFSDWQAPLASGDTVVFIPPVAGG